MHRALPAFQLFLLGLRLGLLGYLDQICPDAVSRLSTLQRRQEFLGEVLLEMEILCPCDL